MKLYPRFFGAAFVAALISVSTAAFGATVTFVPTTGSWGVDANWNSGAVPTNADLALIPAGKTAVIDDGATYSVSSVSLNVGTLSVQNGTLSQTGGAQSLFGTGDGNSYLIVGENGTVSISGANSLIGNGNNNHAHLIIDGGTYWQNTGSVFVGAGNRAIGQTSTASVEITNGGRLHAVTAGIGRDIGNTAYLTVNGGTIDGTLLSFGDNASVTNSMWATGYGTLSNGTISLSGQINVGGVGEGHFLMQKGSPSASVAVTMSGDLRVGGGMGAQSTLEIYDGTFRLNRNALIGDYKAGNFFNGSGAVTVSGADWFWMTGMLTVGYSVYKEEKDNVSSFVLDNTTATIGNGMFVGSYYTTGDYTGSYGNWTGVGGGKGVVSITDTTLTVTNASTIGNGGTGSLIIQNSTVTMAGNLVAGATAFNASTNAGGTGTNEIIYFDTGDGTVELTDSILNMGNAARIYIGQSGTGSMTLNNSTLSMPSSTSQFGIGTYLQRQLIVTNSSAANMLDTGATKVTLQDIRQGTGAFTLNGGAVTLSFAIGVGQGGTGALTVNDGTFYTTGLITAGTDMAIATSISDGAGTLTVTTNSYAGDGTILVTGGTLSAAGMNLSNRVNSAAYATTEKVSTSVMTVSGGVVELSNTMNVGLANSYSSATVAVYNGGKINGIGRVLNVNPSATLIFGLKGGDDAFVGLTDGLINFGTINVNADAEYVVDFVDLAITQDTVVTLATYNTRPGNYASIDFDFINLDEALYEIDGGDVVWGTNALTIGINYIYIPEPAAAASLLGLLALAFAARRRRV